MNTDQIVILEDGKVHCTGTHSELLAHDPIYQEIYRSQMNGALENESAANPKKGREHTGQIDYRQEGFMENAKKERPIEKRSVIKMESQGKEEK